MKQREEELRDLLAGYVAFVDDRLKDIEQSLSTLNKVVASISRRNDDIINSQGLHN